MKQPTNADTVSGMLMEIAGTALDLVREIKGVKGTNYTDGYHKKMTSMIAGLNTSRAALQTLLVQQALEMRAADLLSAPASGVKAIQA